MPLRLRGLCLAIACGEFAAQEFRQLRDAALAKPDTRIPVTIVTGFLGSGKTTLLSSLLRRANGERFAVVVNEFGEVPLDQAFIDTAGGKVVTVAGGCLCCAIAGDIVTTLLALHESRGERAFDRVVIETSGLADPGPLSQDVPRHARADAALPPRLRHLRGGRAARIA